MGSREENREAKRNAIIDAGLQRLLTGSLDALRAVLNASSLSSDADISKDTAYRLFSDGPLNSNDAIVREVAAASCRPEWSGYQQSASQVALAFQDALQKEMSFEEAVITALEANVEAQLESLGGPTGWFLQAAATTASLSWRGSVHAQPNDLALGREILAIRADFYQRMSDDLSSMMTAAMSILGRRPRRGMDPRQITALMHALIDGATLRRFIEPDVFDSRLVAEACLSLAMAFSELGAISDPRRPSSPDEDVVFERMLASAASAWSKGLAPTIESVSRDAKVPLETTRLMFPTIGDLADSVVWTRIMGGGVIHNAEQDADPSLRDVVGTELAFLLALMRRTREAAVELRGAISLLDAEPPTIGIGIREQLIREASEMVRTSGAGVDPRITANELVDAALLGTEGWSRVAGILRVLGIRSV